jgi:hypothetical protein
MIRVTMRRAALRLLTVLIPVLVGAALPAAAEETPTKTRVTVRVLSQDAKWIGSSMGGARVTIRDADTGELLADGVTEGSTGDTTLLVQEPRGRFADLGSEGSAEYRAVLDLDRPTLVEIAARGPLAQLQSAVSATTTRWIVPGKHLTGSGSVVIELSGFVVDVLAPAAHSRQQEMEVEVLVNLTML